MSPILNRKHRPENPVTYNSDRTFGELEKLVAFRRALRATLHDIDYRLYTCGPHLGAEGEKRYHTLTCERRLYLEVMSEVDGSICNLAASCHLEAPGEVVEKADAYINRLRIRLGEVKFKGQRPWRCTCLQCLNNFPGRETALAKILQRGIQVGVKEGRYRAYDDGKVEVIKETFED